MKETMSTEGTVIMLTALLTRGIPLVQAVRTVAKEAGCTDTEILNNLRSYTDKLITSYNSFTRYEREQMK